MIATGHCDTPVVPGWRRRCAPTSSRSPTDGPDPTSSRARVLVVGASARRPARRRDPRLGPPVTLAVGRHTGCRALLPRARHPLVARRPRALDESPRRRLRPRDLRQPAVPPARRPAPTGRRSTCRAPATSRRPPRRPRRGSGAAVSSAPTTWWCRRAAADARLARLVQRIDIFAARTGLDAEVGPPEPFRPFRWPHPSPAVDLPRGHPDDRVGDGLPPCLPVAEGPRARRAGRDPARGRRHARAGPLRDGLYFLRHRNSSFIDGVGR